MNDDENVDLESAQTDGSEVITQTQQSESPVVRIGDLELPESEALELLEKGRGFTRKTMELADERREFEAQRQQHAERLRVVEFFETAPPEQKLQVLDQVRNELTAQTGQTRAPDYGVDPDDLTENEAKLLGIIQQQADKINSIAATLPHITAFVSAQQAQTAAQEAASRIAAKYPGVAVSPETVNAAIKQTNITDPYAAWLVANEDALTKTALVKGVEQGKQVKPFAPTGGGKTVSMAEIGNSASEAIRLERQGIEVTD